MPSQNAPFDTCPPWLAPFLDVPRVREVMGRRALVLRSEPGLARQVLLNARLGIRALEDACRSAGAGPWLAARHAPPEWERAANLTVQLGTLHTLFDGWRVVTDGTRAIVLRQNGWILCRLDDGRVEAQGAEGVKVSEDATFLLGTSREARGRLMRVVDGGVVNVGQLPNDFHGAAFQTGGARVAVVGDEGIEVYDRETAVHTRSIHIPHGYGARVWWSPDGRRILTSCTRGTRMVDVDSGTVCLDHARPIFANPSDIAVWSPDLRELYVWEGRGAPARVIVYTPGATVGVRDVAIGEIPSLAALSREGWPSSAGDVHRWDPEGWEIQRRTRVEGLTTRSFARAGDTAVTLSGNGALRVWRAPWPAPPREPPEHPGRIEAVGFAAHGARTWASGDGVSSLWSEEGERLLVLDGTIDAAGDRCVAVRRREEIVVVDAVDARAVSVLPVGARFAACVADAVVTFELVGRTSVVVRGFDGAERARWPVPAEAIRGFVTTEQGLLIEGGHSTAPEYLEDGPEWHPEWFLLRPDGLSRTDAPAGVTASAGSIRGADGVWRMLDEAADDPPAYPPPVASWGSGSKLVIAWGRRLLRYDVLPG